MTRPLRALVSGYYGFANAGDEAILAGLVHGFREIAPQVQLTVLSANPSATEAEHGVAAAPRGLSSVRSLLSQSDLLISGGGGLLQDTTSWRSPLYYLAVLRLARRAGVPVACLGHGIGPLRRAWVRRLVRRELSHVALLGVRDAASYGLLRDLGVTRRVHVGADLAFLLSPPAASGVEAVWQKAGLERDSMPTAGLALRRPPGPPAPRLAGSLGRAITEIAGPLHLQPVLVPLQRPRDAAFADQVAGEMSVPAQVVRAPLTARDLLALIGGFDLVIAMRLHALVFAAICGRPLVAISYDPKVDSLMLELGLGPATSLAAFADAALVKAAEEAWRRRHEFAGLLAPRCCQLRQAARHSIELALALLQH